MLTPFLYSGASAFDPEGDPGGVHGRLLRPVATPASPDALAQESYIVAVWMRRRAACDCGWEGKPRWLRSSAVQDAALHFTHTRHSFMC